MSEQHCKNCGVVFCISQEDSEFYEKISPSFGGKIYIIPPPTHCASCRAQRRQAQLNYEFIYKRKSNKTGKDIISSFSSEKPAKVFEPKIWWSDDWDAMEYGRTFDATRSFFAEFHELQKSVPVMSLVVDSNENSEYIHYSGWDKNCYLCFCTDYSQDCMYTHSVYYAKNATDCFLCNTIELCYECVYCNDSYNLLYSQNCHHCHDSVFLFDCRGCSNCFGCVGLRKKEYCFMNVQMTKEEYQKKVVEFPLQNVDTLPLMQKMMTSLLQRHPHQAFIGLKNEDVSGDYLFQCKNVKECYDCTDLQDCAFCNSMRGGKDCRDISHWGHFAELCYESVGIGEGASRVHFSACCWPNCADLFYCNFCISCHDCFGCIGLRQKSYCIFNKQYPKEEYEKMVPRIIETMRDHGEWGEFLPPKYSPYAYNESPAQKYYPLTKEEVREKGWQWKDFEDDIPAVQKRIPAERLPKSIDDIPDDVLNWAIVCEKTKRPFKIVKQELDFYRRMKVPLPRLHPDERLKKRMHKRNPRKLWERKCDKCKKNMRTSYAPERSEIVYCEDCYLSTIYE